MDRAALEKRGLKRGKYLLWEDNEEANYVFGSTFLGHVLLYSMLTSWSVRRMRGENNRKKVQREKNVKWWTRLWIRILKEKI